MILGEGTEGALITELVFWTIALSTVVSAIAVVQIRDLFRAASRAMVHRGTTVAGGEEHV